MFPHCSWWKVVLNFSAVKFKYVYGLHLLVNGAYSFMLVLALSQSLRTSFHSHFLSSSLLWKEWHLFFWGLVCGFCLPFEISDLCDSYSCLCLFFILFNSLFLEKKRGQDHIHFCCWYLTGTLCNSSILTLMNIGHFLGFLSPSFPCCCLVGLVLGWLVSS